MAHYIRKNGEAKREAKLLLRMLKPRRRSRFITSEWSTKRFTYIWRPIDVNTLGSTKNEKQWYQHCSALGFFREERSHYPWAISSDEPLRGVWAGSFEHGFIKPEPAYNLGDDVCPERFSTVANIISVNHDHICTCFQASLCPPNQQVNIFNSFCKNGHQTRVLKKGI